MDAVQRLNVGGRLMRDQTHKIKSVPMETWLEGGNCSCCIQLRWRVFEGSDSYQNWQARSPIPTKHVHSYRRGRVNMQFTRFYEFLVEVHKIDMNIFPAIRYRTHGTRSYASI